jgi:hypothetical protein
LKLAPVEEVTSELVDAVRTLERIVLEGERPARVLAVSLMAAMTNRCAGGRLEALAEVWLHEWPFKADLSIAEFVLLSKVRALGGRANT